MLFLFVVFDVLLVLVILSLLFLRLKKRNRGISSRSRDEEPQYVDYKPIPKASDDMTIEEYKGFILFYEFDQFFLRLEFHMNSIAPPCMHR